MKKLAFLLGLALTLAVFVPQIANAQDKKVTIVVVDSQGERIIGASILVVGTSIGTITDMDGVATLSCPPNALLVISYIGYKTTLVPVGNAITLLVVLEEDTETVEEVIV